MKKFYLLMALVLMAGVVQAQTQKIPNFGSRANLKQAVKLYAQYPTTDDDQLNGTYHDNNNDPNGNEIVCHKGWKAADKEMYWSGTNQNGGVNHYEVEIFNENQIQEFLNENPGDDLLDLFENFVIHSDYGKNWKRYYGTMSNNGNVLTGPASGNQTINSAVSYALMFYGKSGVDGSLIELGTMRFWDADVVIAPLRAIRGTNETLNGILGYQKGEILPDVFINSIRSVRIASNSHDGRIKFGDAYFISAIPGLDFKDKDDVDVGNAYIDPSFLIPSNRLSIDIKPDRSFEIVAKAGTEAGSISFSLPYKTGIDISNVTFHQIDFDRTLNVFSRYIVENKIRNIMTDADDQYITVRDLYNSRYSGAFYDQSNGANAIMGGTTDKPRAIQHVNSIYWEMYVMETNAERRVWVQDICFTKNKIQARLTRKPLNKEDWPNQNVEGFRNRDYPVQPYYTDEHDYSDVVRGDWDARNTYNFTDLSRYDKMRIVGSPNTKFDIRYATELEGTTTVNGVEYPTIKGGASGWKTFTVKTDARGAINDSLYASGEASIDLDYLKNGGNHLYLQAVVFSGLESIMTELGNSTNPGKRKNYWCNDVELYEGEGRLVDLVGSADPNNTSNMYHVWNNDNNYQWQYATVVRWAAVNETGLPWGSNFEQKNYSENSPANCTDGNVIWGTGGMYPEYYADLTGYNAIRVYGTSGNVRFVFNTMRNGQAPFLNDNSSFLDARGKGDHNNNDFVFRDQETIGIVDHYDEKNNFIGTYAELDISNYEYFHLNGIKASGAVSGITAIKLVEDEEADYIFYGNGSYGEQGRAAIDHSVNMASNDLTAKVIDARARCNNMQVPYDGGIFGWVEHITLPKTASQNVLFISRNDQFNRRKIGDHVEYQTKKPNTLDEAPSIMYDPDHEFGQDDYVMNDKNGDPLKGRDVILYDNNGKPKTKIVDDVEDFNLLEVSGDKAVNEYTCTNIKLLDGLSFYAPKKIKAGTATYTRTFTNEEAAVVNSIILPFPVDAGSATEKKSPGFYKAGVTLESTATEGRVGILEEQAVKKGDWLLQFSKYTGTTDANMPYLYVVAANTGKTDFTGVAAEGGKVIIPETPNVIEDGKYNMTNYDDALTLVNGEPKEGYYLRGVYEGTSLENILFYGANGTLYRTPRMTVTPFRTIIHSPIPVATTTWEADQDRYFGVTTAGNVKVILADYGNDEAVGIDNVAVDGLFLEDAPIYNVAGQRVNSLDKGIYIVGGKKILVK